MDWSGLQSRARSGQLRARFESDCGACGQRVWEGDPISGPDRWGEYVHAGCSETGQQ